jgi:hypothetical protein
VKTIVPGAFKMKATNSPARAVLAAVLLYALSAQSAFESGSNGANGALSPAAGSGTVLVPLPPDGVLNYTTISIPSGVTVKFNRNAANTPVVLLVQGSVTISGVIDVSGGDAPGAGNAGSGNLADDGQPGLGGPGGYDGGRGGVRGAFWGSAGLGPGGGGAGYFTGCGATYYAISGAGGGFGVAGTAAGPSPLNCSGQTHQRPPAGAVYGSSQLLPLIGGSGGGGGGGGYNFGGAGGGGGGGAILIAASGSITVNSTGQILANGGKGGSIGGIGVGATGGGGSGGAIRLVGRSITVSGQLRALHGGGGVREFDNGASEYVGAQGGSGRIRLEADTTPAVTGSPSATTGAPGPLVVAELPTLRIAKVAGVDVPPQPSGNRDVLLPASTSNPVTIEFRTTGVPAGNTVVLTVTPAAAPAFSKRSPALVGDINGASASVTVDLTAGHTVLSASTTYQIVVGLGESLSRYAMGERVDRLRLSTALGAASAITLITVSGREFELPAAAWAQLAGRS